MLIGGMTQADIKRMMRYVANTFKVPILAEIVDAESDNALTVRCNYFDGFWFTFIVLTIN